MTEPLPSRSALARSAVIRLLILEDVPEDAELEQRVLSRAGITFEAFRVGDRAAFLRALETFKPDLIIADYNLPDIDGLTARAVQRSRLGLGESEMQHADANRRRVAA
jgi:CheY-like chemotaxis protein